MKHTLFRLYYGPAFRAARLERETLVLPPALRALEGRSVLFITDIHMGPLFPEEAASRLMDQAAALNADILCLGGDYAESAEEQERVVELLRRLRPRLGGFAVFGNNDCEHLEYRGRSLASALEDAGITALVDGETSLDLPGGGRLRVAGLNALRQYTTPSAPFFAGSGEGDFRILMAHYPKSLLLHAGNCAARPHLALAGHTHGGQFRFLGLTPYSIGFEAPFTSRAMPASGWTNAPGFPALVSPGIGCSRIPFRLNVPPTIHLITLTCREGK